jgi:putative membrane protein
MRVAATALLALALTARLNAHGVAEALTEPRALSPWDVLAVAVLITGGVLYAAGSWRLARRGAVHARRERVAFWIGWVAMLAAVLPPLDAMALQLFSAHMVQHELMMLFGAPLIIAGRPMSVCLLGFPDRLRAPVVRSVQSDTAMTTWRVLTAPVVAWVLHGLVIWVWHLPALYEWAVHDEAVHAAQHLMFVATSALFWWGLLYGRYGRAGYGAAVFYVFTTAVHTGILGALVTFAGSPLYPSYGPTSVAHGADPLADQQVAGLLMWVPAGIVLTLMGLALFVAWMGESGRRTLQSEETRRRARTVASRSTVLIILLAGLSSGCHRRDDRDRVARELTGGDPVLGRAAIHNYGCDTCHTIPGILTANATVGPPLTDIGRRTYLAGRLENTPENMVRWIKHPRSVDEKTAMPETGVNDRDGRNIAAYLYTLR